MKVLIWIKNVLILLVSLFFLLIGINTLMGSYRINNPMEFLMYFFSASLLILVCIVGILYFTLTRIGTYFFYKLEERLWVPGFEKRS